MNEHNKQQWIKEKNVGKWWFEKTCQTMSIASWFEKRGQANGESQVESKKLGQTMSIAGWFEKVSQWHMRWHMRRMILNPIDYEPDCWLLDTHQCKLGYISTHQCKLVYTSTHQYPSVHISIQEHTTAGPCAAYVICGCHMRHICRHMSYAPRVVAEPKSCWTQVLPTTGYSVTYLLTYWLT